MRLALRWPQFLGCSLGLLCYVPVLAQSGSKVANATYTVIPFDGRKETLQIVWRDQAGQPYRRLARLAPSMAAQGKVVKFAMNAGMYHADLSPVGLLISHGKLIAPLNKQQAQGNFFLKPNGVFLIAESGPRIVASDEFAAIRETVYYATQSGPMLLRQGQLHPAFNAQSPSRLLRNAVCLAGGKLYFTISNHAVNFYEMATYLRDQWHCTEALYLDGVVSSLYSPALKRNDDRVDLGPMLLVLVKP